MGEHKITVKGWVNDLHDAYDLRDLSQDLATVAEHGYGTKMLSGKELWYETGLNAVVVWWEGDKNATEEEVLAAFSRAWTDIKTMVVIEGKGI